MKEKEYRHGLVNAQIDVDLPLQIRSLRKQLVGTQKQFAKLTGWQQPWISAMEKPGEVHFTLETLRNLAESFDVALIVRFAPFSELLKWSGRFSPDNFRVPSFTEELEAASKEEPAAEEKVAATATGWDLRTLGLGTGPLPPSGLASGETLADLFKRPRENFIARLTLRELGLGTNVGLSTNPPPQPLTDATAGMPRVDPSGQTVASGVAPVSSASISGIRTSRLFGKPCVLVSIDSRRSHRTKPNQPGKENRRARPVLSHKRAVGF